MSPPKDYGKIIFHNARASGTIISQLGSGTYDHIGFFGANDTASAVEVGSYQDTTWVVNDAGVAAAGETGKLTNCKYISSTGVRVSGLPKGPYNKNINQVNVFKAAALNTYPDFPNQSSGTLLIEYCASGTSLVNTYNCKLYGYDATGLTTDPPPDITLVGFEINASGKWYSGQSGVWVGMNGSANPLYFVNHSSANGYRAAHKHIWVAAIACKPNSIGVLDDWNLAFQMQYA